MGSICEICTSVYRSVSKSRRGLKYTVFETKLKLNAEDKISEATTIIHLKSMLLAERKYDIVKTLKVPRIFPLAY